MILGDVPPIPTLSEDLPAVVFYADDDGSYFVPVEEEPDQRRAWQRAEATTGAALIPDGRVTEPCMACELGHHCEADETCDAHPDCPGTPCPPAEPTDVWLFLNVDERDEFRAGLAFAWGVAE